MLQLPGCSLRELFQLLVCILTEKHTRGTTLYMPRLWPARWKLEHSCFGTEIIRHLVTSDYFSRRWFWMFSLPHTTTQESSHDTTSACQRDKTLKTLDLEASFQTSWTLTPNGFTIFAELFSHRFMLKHLYQHDNMNIQSSSMLRKVSAAASK